MTERSFAWSYIVLVGLCLVANWPGRVFPDTVDMLWQAQNPSDLGDWHSPYLIFLYGILGPVFGYPGGALLVQSLLLMSWPALVFSYIAITFNRPLIRVILISIWILMCMIFVVLAGQIVKDVILIGFLSIFFAIFSSAKLNRESGFLPESWVTLFLIIVSFVLGRISNLFIVFCCSIALVICLIFSGKWRPTYGLILLGLMVVMVVSVNSSKHLFNATETHPELSPIVFDLAGISFYGGDNVFKGIVGEKVNQFDKQPFECYSPKQSDRFIWGDCNEYSYAIKDVAGLFEFWMASVWNNPVAYLRHRLRFAVELLTKDNSANENLVPTAPFYVSSNSESYFLVEHREKKPILQKWDPSIGIVPFAAVANAFFASPLGHPLVWCSILIVGCLFPVFGGFTVKNELLMMSVAGLSNVLMFILFSGSDDLRYLLPTFFCSVGVVVYWLRSWVLYLR